MKFFNYIITGLAIFCVSMAYASKNNGTATIINQMDESVQTIPRDFIQTPSPEPDPFVPANSTGRYYPPIVPENVEVVALNDQRPICVFLFAVDKTAENPTPTDAVGVALDANVVRVQANEPPCKVVPNGGTFILIVGS